MAIVLPLIPAAVNLAHGRYLWIGPRGTIEYFVRVHYDWFTWKGKQENGQRLLIMAFPGKGDEPVTYRKSPNR
ncbi:hypothetical protein [Streptosporangium sp. LJ11]|uniref:hypothetical protein n=1 Tax=Streptosporangium sp. LJ11 TaxID=3436927 RepID=UPI003F7AE626